MISIQLAHEFLKTEHGADSPSQRSCQPRQFLLQLRWRGHGVRHLGFEQFAVLLAKTENLEADSRLAKVETRGEAAIGRIVIVPGEAFFQCFENFGTPFGVIQAVQFGSNAIEDISGSGALEQPVGGFVVNRFRRQPLLGEHFIQ